LQRVHSANSMKPNRTKIIAHRGASADAPENTLESVQLAWEQNANAVEVDIQLTADQQIVVFHDEDTERMCGQREIVSETNWDRLKSLQIHKKGFKTRIPLLAEILPTIPDGKFLVIEIKAGPEIILPLQQLLQKHPHQEQDIQFISLCEQVMLEILTTFPGYETQRVFEFDLEKPDPHKLLAYAHQTPFHGIDLERGDYLHYGFVDAVHQLKKKIYLWTVNDRTEAQAYQQMGIDGLTTDRPGWLRQQLGL